MNNEQYHAHPAISSSRAKLALESYQLFLDNPKVSPTPSMQLGTLVHMMVLEPDEFESRIVATGPVNPKTGQPYGIGTKAYDTWQEENPDKIVVPDSVRTILERMPDEVRGIFADPDAAREESFFAPAGAVLRELETKARPDHLTSEYITDLKTISDINDIPRAMKNRKYPFSLEWYARVLGETHLDRRWIFAETSPPYRWRIVTLGYDWTDWDGRTASDQVDDAIRAIDNADTTELVYMTI